MSLLVIVIGDNQEDGLVQRTQTVQFPIESSGKA